MQFSLSGAVFVRGCEGFVGHWYLDAGGVGTIGEGFTWRSAAFRKWWAEHRAGEAFGPGATMTREEADQVLILIMEEEVGPAADRAFHGLTQFQRDGVCSVGYNAGTGAYADQWAQALAAGDIARAAALLKTDRITADGKRIAGLVNRRRDEAELIQFGDYTIGAFAPDAMADGILRRGERGPAVTDLQEKLAAIGVYSGIVDGIFGYGTEAAVLAYQRSRKLGVDGIAGQETLASIAGVHT